MDHKSELISFIKNRTQNITNDCRTFLWFKSVHNKEYKSINNLRIGGGNLLMAIGLFSSMEYLCKIYYVLKIGYENIPNSDKQKGRNDIKWQKPLNVLITDYPADFGIKSLSSDKIKLFWKNWRHKLAHLLAQDPLWGQVNAFDNRNENYNEAMENLKNTIPFIQENGRWICNADRLAKEIDSISDWLIKETDKYDDNRIKNTFEWLKNNW